MQSPRLVLPLVFALLPLLAMPACAQLVGLSISNPSPAALNIDPGQSGAATFTVTNTGNTAGSVSFTPPTLAGWTLTLNPSSIPNLPAGQSQTVTLTARAPAADAPAPGNGAVRLSGTITGPAGNPASATSGPLQINYVAPPPPVIPPPPADNSWIAWLVAGLSLVALAGAATGVFFMRSRAVTLDVAQQQKTIDRGTGDAFPVRVENRSGGARTVQLRVAELPPRWVAAFSFPEVKLRAREATTVPVYVRVPGDTPTGAVGRVRVQARPGPYTAWMASAELLTTVTDVRGERPNAFPEAAPVSTQGALNQVVAARSK